METNPGDDPNSSDGACVMAREIIDICVTLKHDKVLAILVNDGTKDVWLPKSIIEYEKDRGKETYTVTLPHWLAIEKGLV